MPRAGDRTAYSLPRIVAELGYLACVAVSCYVQREYLRIDGRHIPPHLVNMAALHLGGIALGKNMHYITSPWQNRFAQCTEWLEGSKAEIDHHMFTPCLVEVQNSKSCYSTCHIECLRPMYGTLNVDEKKTNCTVWWEIVRRTFWA